MSRDALAAGKAPISENFHVLILIMHLEPAASPEDRDLDVTSISIITEPRSVLECFYTMKSISWETTGLCPDSQDTSMSGISQSFWTIITCFLRHEFTPSNLVLYRIWQRDGYLRTQQAFSDIYRVKLQDMPRSQAKEEATREYIQSLAQKHSTTHSEMSPGVFSSVVRKILRTASRWAALVNACESLEIILLDQKCHFHDKTIGEIIEQGTNEEFENWRNSILSPEVHLKEDCMRLSGVVRMIQKLSDSTQSSEVRQILAEEVQERFQIWGERLEGSDQTDQEEPILRLPEILQERFVNEIFGITIILENVGPNPDSEQSNQNGIGEESSNQASRVRPDSENDDLFDFDPFMYTGDGLILDQDYDEWMQGVLSRSPYSLGV